MRHDTRRKGRGTEVRPAGTTAADAGAERALAGEGTEGAGHLRKRLAGAVHLGWMEKNLRSRHDANMRMTQEPRPRGLGRSTRQAFWCGTVA